MPFEPLTQSKTHIEQRFTAALHQIEKELNHHFARYIVRPALSKLKSIISGLNFSTLRKSVVISVSPFQEQVYYLNVPLKEKVVVGRVISARELVQLKKDERRYLLLILDHDKADLYLGQQHQLTPLLHNSARQEAIPAVAQNPMPVQEKPTKVCASTFLKSVDDGLHILQQAYQLPLLVMGRKNQLELFSQLTRNESYMTQLIEKEVLPHSKQGLHQVLQPFITIGWQRLYEKYLLLQLEHALSTGHIAVGVDEVWKAAHEKRTRLLVIEKDYAYPAYSAAGTNSLYTDDLQPVDVVDEAIETVLAGGGNVEFVEKGVLKDYLHMALI